MAMHYIVY